MDTFMLNVGKKEKNYQIFGNFIIFPLKLKIFVH